MEYLRYETAKKFLEQCLDFVTNYGAGWYIENVAVLFTKDAEAGKFDETPEEEYRTALNEVEELAGLWNKQPRKTAGELLLSALERCEVPPNRLKTLVRILAKCFAAPNPDKTPGAGSSLDADPMFGDDDLVFDPGPALSTTKILDDAFKIRSAKDIRDTIARRVLGQAEAVRTAAMITHNHLMDRQTHAVFCGPSGCGKSEIWRTLSKEYPGLIRMIDFSRFAADGWKGSVHLRDIFEGIDPEDIKRRGLIVVLDEADKIVCEHAIGAGGTDHNALAQNSLLKMLDGDVIEFGAEDGKSKLSVDCSKVSVVLLGAFERLLVNKSASVKHIGFGTAQKADAGCHRDITHEDLISAGMRREIAGRVNRIVALDPLTANDYKAILTGPVLSGIQDALRCKIRIASAAADALAEQAVSSGLGVRWMKSELQNAVDDAMFDAPEPKSWQIGLRDGKLRCQEQKPRKTAPDKNRDGLADAVALARSLL